MPGSLIDKGFRIPQMTNGFLLSEMMNANEHVQNDIPKWVRVIAIAIGILLVSVMALILLGVAVDLLSDGSESWFTQVSMALFAALVGVIGAQLVYLGVTGKRGGRLQRWLSAIRDAISEVH